MADYPYSLFIDFITTADKVTGRGDFGVCRKLGRYAATRDIQSFLKLTKQGIKPTEMVVAAGALWKNYHLNSGQMKVEDTAPEHTVIRIYDFPAMSPAHCRLLEGYFAQAVKEAGAVWVEEIRELACMSRGAPFHEFAGRWRYP